MEAAAEVYASVAEGVGLPRQKFQLSYRGPHYKEWLDQVPVNELVEGIEYIIDQTRPEMVVIPSPAETHQEHEAVYRAAMIAMRPSGGTDRYRPPRIVTFEHLADAWRRTTPVVPASWYVQLTEEDLVVQRQAMTAHASQVRPAPSERSYGSMQALARVRGAEAGVHAAEVFGVLRWLS